jgi:cytochrome c peroxidase
MPRHREHIAVFCLSIAILIASLAWRTHDGFATPLPSDPPFVWQLPPGLPRPLVPADNPMSVAKVALGRMLFYDTRLSGNHTYACASCHQQAKAFTDGRPQAIGSTGSTHPRSAMSLSNVAYNVSFGWADGSTRSLEGQIAVPMFNEHPIELGVGGREAEIVGRFAAQPEYARRFAAAFPGDARPVSLANIVRALASFERTLLSGDSPLDRYLYRDQRDAIPPAAIHGMKLFFSKEFACATCHESFNLSGPVKYQGSPVPPPLFHNNGLYNVDGRGGYPASDRGLIDKSGKAADMGRFRAPTLRNIALTAPYMHDGSLPTLEAVLVHYASGGHGGPYESEKLQGFTMTPADRADLMAFLNTLTDRTFVTNAALARPVLPQ